MFRAKWIEHLLNLLLTFGFLLLLIDQAHKQQADIPDGDWESAIFADASGYYFYLPTTFIYKWEWQRMPKDIGPQMGVGFMVDHVKGKVSTKFTYVVALMQAPFFMVAHQLTLTRGGQIDGFTGYYRRAPVWAGVFWGWAGLLMLRGFLRRRFSSWVSWLTVAGVLLGTNLLYYSTARGGFSHVYNFALVSGFLLLLQSWVDRPGRGLKLAGIMGLLALIALSRPTNAMLTLLVLFWEISSLRQVWQRLRSILSQWPGLLLGCLLSFIVLLPQMLYWNYLSGSPLFWSYNDEGFHNAFSPQLPLVWFAPHNGMFPYAPLLVLLLLGGIWGALSRAREGSAFQRSTYFLMLLGFCYMSYISAAWHMPTFGTGYGHRNLVDYLPLLSVGFAFLLHRIGSNSWASPKGRVLWRRIPWLGLAWRMPVLLLVALSVGLSLRLTRVYSGTWWGKDDWSWEEYRAMLDIWPKSFKRRFENPELVCVERRADTPDGEFVLHIRPETDAEIIVHDIPLSNHTDAAYRHANVSAQVRTESPQPTALLDFQCLLGDSASYKKYWYVLEDIQRQGEWTSYRRRMVLPRDMPLETHFIVSIRNPFKSDFWIDDVSIDLY